MKRFRLADCGARGWFIGNFAGAVHQTKDFEVCYQNNPRSRPDSHIHNEITEITLVISGRALVNGEIFSAGDIHIIYPGEPCQIEYLEQTEVVTIKTPSIPSDKQYL